MVGGLGCVGQNKMCCNLCRLVGGIAALFILRSVGILSVVLMFVYRLSCRLLGLQLTEKVLAKDGLLCCQFQRKTEPEQNAFSDF